MTSIGGLLWIIAIGAPVYFMMRKGGGCCGSGHSQDKGHEADNEQPRGGCCG